MGRAGGCSEVSCHTKQDSMATMSAVGLPCPCTKSVSGHVKHVSCSSPCADTPFNYAICISSCSYREASFTWCRKQLLHGLEQGGLKTGLDICWRGHRLCSLIHVCTAEHLSRCLL